MLEWERKGANLSMSRYEEETEFEPAKIGTNGRPMDDQQ